MKILLVTQLNIIVKEMWVMEKVSKLNELKLSQEEKVIMAINKLKYKKSPDPDQITNDILFVCLFFKVHIN